MRTRALCGALCGLLLGCAGTVRPPVVVSPESVAPRSTREQFPSNQAVTVAGALENSDEQDHQGRRADHFSIQLAAGERIRVELSGSFDTLLRIVQPSGEALENDDAEEGTLDSRLQFVAHAEGTYQILATSFAPNTLGLYRLRVARGTGIPRPEIPQGPTLTSGSTTRGELARSDQQERSGRFYDDFKFEGRRGELLVLDLASDAFDTYISVTTPSGERWISDDITGANTNSRVQATLGEEGTYGVRVTSYRPGAVGAYSLRLDRTAAPQRGNTPAGMPVPNVAGRRGLGSVYGIFVGIRDYGSEANNLPFCDDDARELARTLRESGVQTAQQQTVLVNSEATPAALRSAVSSVASRMGPEDVLVLFYSGHGSQVAGQTSVTEPDGLDETIRMRGGSVRDDELAAMLQPVQGTVLVALDSCYSGGFARDVVNGPNRVGFFSSEEDVLSNVVPRWRAGGYLSYWLRLAFQGAADQDHDRSLRWGEVADYLFGEFATHRQETGTSGNGGGRTFQHLIVARGSVVATDLLLRYPE